MKSDIVIPTFENIFLAAVEEWSEDFNENIWNVYLINDSDYQIDNVMVVSKAFGLINGEMKKTSSLRHAFIEIPSVSVKKIEMIEKSVLLLNNEFMTTFFIDDKLFDRKFVFEANSLKTNKLEEVPHLWKEGVIIR